jgi:CheY-like chemotaxis protein
MLPRVFDLFTQVGKHLDRAQGGLGIGLALVKRLAELHGGCVSAASAGTGQGSTFALRSPIRTEMPAEGEEPPWPAPARPNPPAAGGERPRRVLVVDDNADAAESLAEWLALRGHHVQTARCAEEALAAAPQFRPEVVFLDIGLPGMSGYDLAPALRRDGGCAGSAFVALTGWGTDEDRRRSEEAGFVLHLIKPVENAKLDAVFAQLGRSVS